jgi:hypothetical protein
VDPLAALASPAVRDDPDALLAALLDGWEDSYEDGRKLLLGRLHMYRATHHEPVLSTTAQAIYQTLIAFGEELADMRWVHLAVECRDALQYGFGWERKDAWS